MVGGGDGDTRAGCRVLSGGNLNLQTRQSGNGHGRAMQDEAGAW